MSTTNAATSTARKEDSNKSSGEDSYRFLDPQTEPDDVDTLMMGKSDNILSAIAARLGWIFTPQHLNVLLLGLGFMVVFAAYEYVGLMTLNHGTWGSISLGIVYGVFSFSSFVTPFVEKMTGAKAGILVGVIPYALFVLASGFTIRWLLVAASMFLGFGAALLWTAHGSYLAKFAGDDIGFHTGIFFAIFQLKGITGNIVVGVMKTLSLPQWIISTLLFGIALVGGIVLLLIRNAETSKAAVEVSNGNNKKEQTGSGTGVEEACGKEINEDEGDRFEKAPDEEYADDEIDPFITMEDRNITLDRDGERVHADTIGSVSGSSQHAPTLSTRFDVLRKLGHQFAWSVRSTVQVTADKRKLLLMPMYLYSGYSLSFFIGRMPPVIGDRWAAWTLAVYSLAGSCGGVIFGKLADLLGKRAVTLAAFAAHGTALLMSLLVDTFAPYSFFATMFTCGMAVSGINTAIYSIIGTFFSKTTEGEPSRTAEAFSAFNFVESLSSTAGFVSGLLLSYWSTQMVLIGIYVFAVVAFIILDLAVAPVNGSLSKT